ncbi:DUF2771 domain-containing protein [Corynebacterium crudilactis]|uniref:DUF2771 domain-containing protein n=1 Tax=Corynebacterium crudilactis TaxID=1652495 RepID=A0A172QRZ6_9CORY|nr:DUF2771 domain-containing protein [Corynebacterium crudilactis]ANE03466.1 hypothetical protein ccrud_04045 [Corynebacterium crudilactis]
MASRKTKRKNLIQILSLIVAVVLVVIVSVMFQQWWNNRPEPLPQNISIAASAPAGEVEVFPFSLCEPGVECEENDIPTLDVGADEELHLSIPETIHDHDWYLLTIYDDPTANDEFYHTSYDATEATVPGSVDPTQEGGERPRLVVVEISSVMIGQDENGEEAPYTVTWSLSTMSEPEN